MSKTIHTALDIARWFLQRNDIEQEFGDAEYISNLKLQKFLYYAQETYTEDEEEILNQVYEYFGQYSAWKLHNMTHQERP